MIAVADLKLYIGLNDTSRDALLATFVDAAKAEVINFLGYDPATQTYTNEAHEGDRSDRIYTFARPITAITAISIDGVAVDVTQVYNRKSYIDLDDYRIATGAQVLVTYTAGYATIPATIKLAALKLAAMMDQEHGRTGRLGIASRSDAGGTSVTFESDPDAILDTLTAYRRLHHG